MQVKQNGKATDASARYKGWANMMNKLYLVYTSRVCMIDASHEERVRARLR